MFTAQMCLLLIHSFGGPDSDVCVCVSVDECGGVGVCAHRQPARSGGACVAAALAQDRSLATAGSAHLKHVATVFAGPRMTLYSFGV